MQRLYRFAAVIVAGGLLSALTVTLLVPQVKTVVSAHDAEPVRLDLDPLAQRSIVLAADGRTVLASLHGAENRAVIPLDDMPPVLVATVLAVEDADFYEHAGLDVRAIIRALFTDVRVGSVREGGSTITQQLVKNALLDPRRDFGRKLKEAVLALRLEDQLSKREILERYLNTVYLGNGVYGVQAAAEVYFGKDAGELDAAESALIAGLIKNPTGDDPFRHPKAAAERRAQVVRRLQRVGALDDGGAHAILAVPLPTEPHTVLPKPDDHFVNEVVRLLLRDERLARTKRARYDALFRGGLTIRTTLDAGLQEKAVAAVRDTLPDTGGTFTAALVSIDPSSGAVRSLVGGEGFDRSKYNIATQGIGRQVGSAFKPIVLAAAVEKGISPTSTISGVMPCRFPNPGGTPDPYEAENYEGQAAGVETLAEATVDSINCAYLRLGQIVGLGDVVAMASRLGITADLLPHLSLPLGTGEVRPIDMAAAYATLANDGVRNRPYFVDEVRGRDGKVVFRNDPDPQRVVSSDVARTVTDVLTGVLTEGTGRAARFPDGRPAAGKTGTTEDFGDAWFVGYTAQLSTAVWMGSPLGNTIKMRDVAGVPRVTGGSFPARIWQAFMGPAHDGWLVVPFQPPPPWERGPYLRVSTEADRRRPVTRPDRVDDDGDEDADSTRGRGRRSERPD